VDQSKKVIDAKADTRHPPDWSFSSFLWRHHPATRVAAWGCKLAAEAPHNDFARNFFGEPFGRLRVAATGRRRKKQTVRILPTLEYGQPLVNSVKRMPEQRDDSCLLSMSFFSLRGTVALEPRIP
jgi:hypothetical protein